jgi:hypothetical protein
MVTQMRQASRADLKIGCFAFSLALLPEQGMYLSTFVPSSIYFSPLKVLIASIIVDHLCPVEPNGTMPPYESLQSGTFLSQARSDQLKKTKVRNGALEPRLCYLKHRESLSPPDITYSHFIPKATVEFLMRWKKDSAIGVKFFPLNHRPDRITNLEGALHTFVTPVVHATMRKYCGVNHVS